MKKKLTIYSELSKKQLLHLKEVYIQKKVKSMSHQELKEFVLDIISHQINDTIGKEEEMEAWAEMSNFFGEEFEITIQEVQSKYAENGNENIVDEDTQKYRLELLEKNSIDNKIRLISSPYKYFLNRLAVIATINANIRLIGIKT